MCLYVYVCVLILKRLEGLDDHILPQIVGTNGIVQTGRDAAGDEEVFVLVGEGREFGRQPCFSFVH